MGSFAVVALMAGTAVRQFSCGDNEATACSRDYSPVEVAATLTFVTGIVQVGLFLPFPDSEQASSNKTGVSDIPGRFRLLLHDVVLFGRAGQRLHDGRLDARDHHPDKGPPRLQSTVSEGGRIPAAGQLVRLRRAHQQHELCHPVPVAGCHVCLGLGKILDQPSGKDQVEVVCARPVRTLGCHRRYRGLLLVGFEQEVRGQGRRRHTHRVGYLVSFSNRYLQYAESSCPEARPLLPAASLRPEYFRHRHRHPRFPG